MRSINELSVAWLLATTASAFVLPRAPLEAEPVNTTLLRPRYNQRYDQMRLLTCRSYKGDRHDRIIGYYDHSPQGAEKPTQVAFKELNASPSWEKGCDGHGKSTDGAEWACDIAPYKWDETKYFKKWMGTITYGYTGFNCFHDDGHATHYQDDGVCYSELYCTHERQQSLVIDASKQTVKAEYKANGVEAGKKPNLPDKSAKQLVRMYLERIKENTGEQQCSLNPVPLTVGCQATIKCSGTERKYLTKLVDALIATYDHEKNDKGEALYSGYESKDCFAQPPRCDALTNRCKYLPDRCDYVKGVELPAVYKASLVSKVPPNADESNGELSVPLSNLEVTIQCNAQQNNGVMCGAMKTLFSGLSLFGPMAAIFGAAALGTEAVCS